MSASSQDTQTKFVLCNGCGTLKSCSFQGIERSCHTACTVSKRSNCLDEMNSLNKVEHGNCPTCNTRGYVVGKIPSLRS